MSTPVDPTLSENIYPIDPESGAEMARLMEQDHLFTKGMRGLFAERSDLSQIHRILDVACGPPVGGPFEVAFACPEKEVVDFDISQTMINVRAQLTVLLLAGAQVATTPPQAVAAR